jgi:hypothetical protein
MQRVAMTFAAMLGFPVAIGGAAPLHPAGAWAPANPPVPVESPAAPEVVPVQQPTVEPPVAAEEPPATAEEPATTEPVDTVSPEGESGPVTVEAAPTTEDATTPEPEPDPAATRSVATPWPAPPRRLPPAEPPPPPGTGMRVGGSILIGTGALDVLVGTLGLIATNTADDEGALDPTQKQAVRRVSTAQLVIGLVELGSGVGLLVGGVLRSRRLRAWENQHLIVAPKTGNGMIVGGSVLLGMGIFDGIATGLVARQTGEVSGLSVVVTAAELATGAALLGVGLVRKKRYREWERSNFAAPSLSLLPGGMAMGLRGRF